MTSTTRQELSEENRLVDVSGSGRRIEWDEKKLSNEFLSRAYDEFDIKKAERLRSCAEELTFATLESGRKKLVNGHFCRVRLCPICQWRRSLKSYGQMRAVLHELAQEREYSYIMLTLTMRNVSVDGLSEALDRLSAAFNLLTMYVDVKRAVKGWYRGVEVTHNLDPSSKEYDTYHPHIHVVAAVLPSYFKKSDYIKQARWAELWQRALKVDYTPIVDVRRIKGEDQKAVAEVTKYAVKAQDYIIFDDWDLTIETVQALDKILNNRRFTAMGGVMKAAHKKLHLDDMEDGDLVRVDPADKPICEDLKLVVYGWHSGYCQYKRVEER